MSVSLNSFPVLTPEIFQKIGYIAEEYEFSYSSDEEFPLKQESITQKNDVIKLTDERCEWSPDHYNIKLNRKLRISTPVHLFGSRGLACNTAKIGIAVVWMSKASNQRGIIKCGEFSREDFSPEVQVEYDFKEGTLTGSFTLATVLYLSKGGIPEANEKFLANQQGIILGLLDEYTVIIDGNGSIFPIVEVNIPNQPLWWVKCNWTDPTADNFDQENVQICLNAAHKDFGLFDLKEGLKNSPMLCDVIATALAIIIQKVKDSDYWDDTIKGNSLSQGSVSQAVHYFITTFGWDWQSPEKLALSIRADFDKRFK